MIECRRLENAEELVSGGVWQLYEEAFPRAERRSLAQHCRAMAENTSFYCLEMRDAGGRVGLLFYWELEFGVFVEHFAICTGRRGRGLGHKVLNYLKQWEKPIVLEAELPNDETAQRRLRFYHSAGFSVLPCRHVQLPFHRDTPELPMHLLSWPAPLAAAEVQRLERCLRERIMLYAD